MGTDDEFDILARIRRDLLSVASARSSETHRLSESIQAEVSESPEMIGSGHAESSKTPRLLVAAALTVVCGLGVYLVQLNDNDGGTQVEGPSAANDGVASPTAPIDEPAEPLLPAPLTGSLGTIGFEPDNRGLDLPVADGYVVAATESSIFVWGGSTREGEATNAGHLLLQAGGEWESTPDSPLGPRHRPSGVALSTGEFLVLGGFSELGRLSDGAVLDPDTGIWAALTIPSTAAAVSIGSLVTSANGATAIVLDHSTAEVATPDTVVGARLVEFDASSRSWTELGPLPVSADQYELANDGAGQFLLHAVDAATLTEEDYSPGSSLLYRYHDGSWSDIPPPGLPPFFGLRANSSYVVGFTTSHELVAVDRRSGEVTVGAPLSGPTDCPTIAEILPATSSLTAWSGCVLDPVWAGEILDFVDSQELVEGEQWRYRESIVLSDRVVIVATTTDSASTLRFATIAFAS